MRIHARLAALSLVAWMTVVAADPGVVPPPVAALSPEVVALATAQSAITTLSGDFRWLTGTVDGSGEVREKVGIFAVVRGLNGARNKYNVRLANADDSDMHRWCSDGIGQWEVERVIEGEQPLIRTLKPGRQDIDLDRVLACVLLDLPQLTPDFSIRIETTAAGRTLIFTPLTAALKEQLTRMAVVLDGDDPREVIIDDSRNVRIRLVLQHLVKNKDQPEGMFSPLPKDQPKP